MRGDIRGDQRHGWTKTDSLRIVTRILGTRQLFEVVNYFTISTDNLKEDSIYCRNYKPKRAICALFKHIFYVRQDAHSY